MNNSFPVFVVHKHKATTLHYDFRLEIDGTMPSWSIPKGPTLDNTIKRLALPTKNHPLDYRHFEGIIQDGLYGAGTVMIWDEGHYIPEIEIAKGVRKEVTERKASEQAMKEGLRKGELKFFLYGKKLRGSFALIKTKGWGPKDSWLLLKHKDQYARIGYEANDYDISAASKRSLAEIEGKK
ncbi:MAG TPA: DNA polymerase ligase N-terminal domain-containing protein [Patescibacteria group bacterium]|nr:DNA polymerase ligase N-terminal domain-containing protein [Patescibacteria group bacterium]